MPRMISLILAWTACVSLVTPSQAQRGDVRFGPWVSVGIAPGVAGIDCSTCAEGSRIGVAGSLAAGGTPSERVSVGIEGIAWRALETDTTREFLSLIAVAYYYQSSEGGLFLRVGAGGGRYAEESADHRLTSNGFALQFTVGYEMRIRRTLWMTPYGYYFLAPEHSAKRNQFVLVDRLRFSMFQLGLAVTWRML